MRQGLESFAGPLLRQTLAWLTLTTKRGFASGILLTALLQSSTAVTVFAVSIVDAGLLPFENTLAVILGSNIGTTLTPQMLAFPLQNFAVIAMAAGACGFLFLRGQRRFLASAILGLGSLFWGLFILQSSLAPLAEAAALQNFLRHLGDHHLQGIVAGTVMSALLHSSAAATAVIMLLTDEGWLSITTALSFVLGANIGTCFTAVIASLASSRSAQRVALFHILLNVLGVLLFLPLLDPFTRMITGLGGNLARQVANAHTIFNLASSLLALPFLPLASKLLLKLRQK